MLWTGLDLDGLLDIADEILNHLGVDVPLVGADADASLNLGDVKVLVVSISLDDSDGLILHTLIACEPVAAFKADTAPSHGTAVTGCPSLQDLVFHISACRTSHSVDASDKINQRRREHYDQIYAEQQNNYNAKVVLCEKAEEVTAQPATNAKEFNAISDQLTELLKMWKTLGAAPVKVNEEIWNRFKGTLDKFFEKKKEFFGKIKDEQQTNYNMKVNLAIRAEAIAKRTDWRAATDEILQLQKEWKEIGATSRKHSEAIWKRFRTACDQFFEAKSNYFNNAQEIEAENLKKKEDLIERLKNHAFGADRNENLEAIKAYQREWTEIGFVPKKEKDRIYAAYREALDQRFADLKISAEDRKRDNYRSRINNILSDPNADRLLDKEKRFLMNKLDQLKNDISIWENNLGFFANSKNADLLKAEFSKKIDAAKQEVKELEYKLKMMNEKPKEE